MIKEIEIKQIFDKHLDIVETFKQESISDISFACENIIKVIKNKGTIFFAVTVEVPQIVSI